MEKLGKDLDRARYDVVKDGAALVYTEVKTHRIASDIYGVR